MVSAQGPWLPEDSMAMKGKSTTEVGLEVYLDKTNLLVDTDLSKGKYLATCWFFNGDIMPKDVPCATLKTKRTV